MQECKCVINCCCGGRQNEISTCLRSGGTHRGAGKQTPQQHNNKAAQRHDHACKPTRETGKCCGSGSFKFPAPHALVVRGHTFPAAAHGAGVGENWVFKHYLKTGTEGGSHDTNNCQACTLHWKLPLLSQARIKFQGGMVSGQHNTPMNSKDPAGRGRVVLLYSALY